MLEDTTDWDEGLQDDGTDEDLPKKRNKTGNKKASTKATNAKKKLRERRLLQPPRKTAAKSRRSRHRVTTDISHKRLQPPRANVGT